MAHCSNVKCLWRLTVVDKLLEYCLCCWRKQNISQSSVHNFKRNYVNNTLWINWFGKKYLSDDYITKWCRFKMKKNEAKTWRNLIRLFIARDKIIVHLRRRLLSNWLMFQIRKGFSQVIATSLPVWDMSYFYFGPNLNCYLCWTVTLR